MFVKDAASRRPCNRQIVTLLLLILSLLLIPNLVSAQSSRDGDYTGIFLIDAYHEGYAWSDDVAFTAVDILENAGVEVQVVHMDTKNNTDEEFRLNAAQEVMDMIDRDYAFIGLQMNKDKNRPPMVDPLLLDH